MSCILTFSGARAGVLVAALGLVAPSVFAQNRPFPQNVVYPHGFRTTRLTADDARTQYDLWKTRYLKTDCGNGNIRVEFGSPTGTTVSEGMGYGMVLTAYFGDKASFDGLWKFVQKNINGNGVMGWKVDCNGYVAADGGQSSATDGDLDIAFALRVAMDQWGDTYRQPATTYLSAVKAQDFTTCGNGRVMAKAGDWGSPTNTGGGCNGGSNTSYWMPGYYRVFNEFTGDGFWIKAASDAYALLLANRNATTGFVGNEVDQNGAIANGQNQVDYNGCRIPWRIATDFVWYGTADAQTFDDTLTDWAATHGINNLVDGYLVDGTPQGTWRQSNPWTGGWAVGAMTKDQARVDQFTDWFKGCNADDDYYATSLRSLYMLILTGNFWRPGTSASGGSGGAGGATAHPTGGSSGGSVSAGAGGTGAANGSSSKSGCGCRTAGYGAPFTAFSAVPVAIGIMSLRRRRRRTSGSIRN